MSSRATLEEVKEFANKVRKAGGGNPLDALMPAVPADSKNCLIAKNLNFNCEVNGDGGKWYMALDDLEICNRIASALGLETGMRSYAPEYMVYLPDEIGAVAEYYDQISEVLGDLDDVLYMALNDLKGDAVDKGEEEPTGLTVEQERRIVQEELAIRGFDPQEVEEFWPYIDEAIRESYSLATLVNDDGSIVI